VPALFDPKLDVVFKLLFAAERSRALLCSLLEAVLRPAQPIAAIEVLKPDIAPGALGDRSVVLDLLVRLGDGSLVDVEMQTVSRPDTPQRALFHWARLASSGLRRGESFGTMRRAVVILILAHRAIEGAPFHGIYRVRERTTGVELGDALEIHTVELPKLGELDGAAREAEAALVRWARFFAASDERELTELARMDAVMGQARTILEELMREPSAQEAARQRELGLFCYHHSLRLAREEGHTEGRAEGKVEGRAEGKVEGRAEAILCVLAARGLVLSAAHARRIRKCRDLAQLDAWLAAAATARSVEDLGCGQPG
jgi:predicted transposase/invertase (TIGR01784 family)